MFKLFKDTVFVLSFLFKVVILILSFYYIYEHLFIQNDFVVFSSAFKIAIAGKINSVLLFFVFLLMIFNWSLESLKWKLLIRQVHEHSFFLALQAVFAGLTVGIFTPNRIGEVAGKLIFLNKGERLEGAFLAGVGSFIQFLLTIIFGVFSLFSLIKRNQVNFSDYYYFFLSFLMITLLFFALVFFIRKKLKNFSFIKNIKENIKRIFRFKTQEILYVLSLSVTRYFIFFFQFFILLRIFMVGISFKEALMIIPAIFFVITVVPSFAFADIGIRGAVSVFFIGIVSNNEIGVFAASISLWVINLALPAIAGNVVILRYRFKSNLK